MRHENDPAQLERTRPGTSELPAPGGETNVQMDLQRGRDAIQGLKGRHTVTGFEPADRVLFHPCTTRELGLGRPSLIGPVVFCLAYILRYLCPLDLANSSSLSLGEHREFTTDVRDARL